MVLSCLIPWDIHCNASITFRVLPNDFLGHLFKYTDYISHCLALDSLWSLHVRHHDSLNLKPFTPAQSVTVWQCRQILLPAWDVSWPSWTKVTWDSVCFRSCFLTENLLAELSVSLSSNELAFAKNGTFYVLGLSTLSNTLVQSFRFLFNGDNLFYKYNYFLSLPVCNFKSIPSSRKDHHFTYFRSIFVLSPLEVDKSYEH